MSSRNANKVFSNFFDTTIHKKLIHYYKRCQTKGEGRQFCRVIGFSKLPLTRKIPKPTRIIVIVLKITGICKMVIEN